MTTAYGNIDEFFFACLYRLILLIPHSELMRLKGNEEKITEEMLSLTRLLVIVRAQNQWLGILIVALGRAILNFVSIPRVDIKNLKEHKNQIPYSLWRGYKLSSDNIWTEKTRSTIVKVLKYTSNTHNHWYLLEHLWFILWKQCCSLYVWRKIAGKPLIPPQKHSNFKPKWAVTMYSFCVLQSKFNAFVKLKHCNDRPRLNGSKMSSYIHFKVTAAPQ